MTGKVTTLKQLFPKDQYKLVKVYRHVRHKGLLYFSVLDAYVYAILTNAFPKVSIASLSRIASCAYKSAKTSLLKLASKRLVGCTSKSAENSFQFWGPISFIPSIREVDQRYLKDVVSNYLIVSSQTKSDGTTHKYIQYNWAAVPVTKNARGKLRVEPHQIRKQLVITADAYDLQTRGKYRSVKSLERLLQVSRNTIRNIRKSYP